MEEERARIQKIFSEGGGVRRLFEFARGVRGIYTFGNFIMYKKINL